MKRYIVTTENPQHTFFIDAEKWNEIETKVHDIMIELHSEDSYEIYDVKVMKPEKSCRGCYYDIGNQEAHTEYPYGCLFSRDSTPSPTPSPIASKLPRVPSDKHIANY